jgi:hypothetical protein
MRFAQFVLLLLGTLARVGSATPGDWCVRPESAEYIEVDVLPMSGVKSVYFPTGLPGSFKSFPATYVFSADGLVVSVSKKTLTKKECITSFKRHSDGRLQEEETPCNDEPWRINRSYTYQGTTYFEHNRNGTVATTVSPSPAANGNWQVKIANVDRKISMHPGTIAIKHYDEHCRRTGHATSSSKFTPLLDRLSTVETTGDGHLLLRTYSDTGLIEELEYDHRGLKIREKFLSLAVDIDYSYQVDSHGNWIERRANIRQARKGEPIDESEHVVRREITYY